MLGVIFDMDSLCNDYDLDEVLKKTIKLEIRYNKKRRQHRTY